MDKETKIVKLKLDLIFKRVFGTEEHKGWLANLVANLLADCPKTKKILVKRQRMWYN